MKTICTCTPPLLEQLPVMQRVISLYTGVPLKRAAAAAAVDALPGNLEMALNLILIPLSVMEWLSVEWR